MAHSEFSNSSSARAGISHTVFRHRHHSLDDFHAGRMSIFISGLVPLTVYRVPALPHLPLGSLLSIESVCCEEPPIRLNGPRESANLLPSRSDCSLSMTHTTYP